LIRRSLATRLPGLELARRLERLFDSLDFVYMPSRDVAADTAHFVEHFGASLVFAIEAFGTRVAMLNLSEGSPAVLLADHLEGDRPVLVYRVSDLEQASAELARRGAGTGARFEIPHGPGIELETNGPQRIALYQLTRPQAQARLQGRRDF
jgi:urease beta subunit